MESCDTVITQSPQNNASAPVRRHHHRHNVKSRYEFIKTLGKGTYGKVKLARHKETDQLVAIKAIRKDRVKDSADMRHLRREMEIMSSIQHPHIIQIYEVFENQDKIVIVMEYAAGGELYDHLATRKGVPDKEARTFFSQIVSAIRYCHRRGIVHRDLKLENILLDENRQIKIADFGLANYFQPDLLLNTFCGSPLYASPEIVCGVPYKGPEVDSWSLGVLLYALVYGTMPFDGRNFPILTKQITTGNFCKPAKLSDAHGLIHWMLTVDPGLRATIHDIADHEWVRAGQNNAEIPEVTHQASSYTNYLESCESASDLNDTLKAADTEESMQPKSILKHKSGSGDESPTGRKKQSKLSTDDENLAGQLAVACGLHAKDSLKLKAKPHSASGKRRVLRSRRDRESGYYSSPERANVPREKSNSSEPMSNVPQIKSSLIGGRRLNKLGVKQGSVPLKMPLVQSGNKECYLMPINPGPDERIASVSSDDGCSVGSLTRPASTYSDSSILSSDSFDLCTFDGAGHNRNESNNHSLPFSNTPHRPSSLPLETASYISENPPGTLTPKSEKLVRDLQRILAPSRRRRDRTPAAHSVNRPLSVDENSNLSAMVNQLNVELDLAYKKGVDVCANLKPAEV